MTIIKKQTSMLITRLAKKEKNERDTAMKSTELMIGDWVYYGDKPVQVLQLSDGKDYPHIKPIPLTPEILEKNGFSGEGYNMGVIGFHTDPIPEVKDGYEVFIWKDMCLDIKHGFTHLKRYTFYVHELQHALRLCGIEKEITI